MGGVEGSELPAGVGAGGLAGSAAQTQPFPERGGRRVCAWAPRSFLELSLNLSRCRRDSSEATTGGEAGGAGFQWKVYPVTPDPQGQLRAQGLRLARSGSWQYSLGWIFLLLLLFF